MSSFFPKVYVLLFLLKGSHSGYVITAPKKLTADTEVQVCFSITNGTVNAEDSLSLIFTGERDGGVSQVELDLDEEQGERSGCTNFEVPEFDGRDLRMNMSGSLNGEDVFESLEFTYQQNSQRTFVQTDKALYKPGQTVNIRLLTVDGPSLDVSTENYEEIFLLNPSGTRIAQWLDVNNTNGLVHLEFQLFHESEEGFYQIGVNSAAGDSEFGFPIIRAGVTFQVEDYILPRYKVTVEPVGYVLGNDSFVTIEVCARYTYGEPVQGTTTLYVGPTEFGSSYNERSLTRKINGCRNFTFSGEELLLEENNCHTNVRYLQAAAIVEEESTGVELTGINGNIQVHRRVIRFIETDPAYQPRKKYVPISYMVRAIFPDNSPAINEPLQVCIHNFNNDNPCKFFNTDEEGFVKFFASSEYTGFFEITAINYPAIRRNRNNILEESSYTVFNFRGREYLDPFDYSLTLLLEDELQCVSGQESTYVISVLYVAAAGSSADVNLQILSREGTILFETMNVEFSGSDIPFDEDNFMTPFEDLPDNLSRGVFNFTVSLDESISPSVTVLIWYSTEDGLVVAESQQVDVSECLSHSVEFTWSEEVVQPGGEATLSITGASNAICSISVLDRSVGLLSPSGFAISVRSVLDVAYFSTFVPSFPNQLNEEYCERKLDGEDLPNEEETENQEENQDQPSESEESRGPGGPGGPGGPRQSELIPSFPLFFEDFEAIHMFDRAGLYVISNLEVETTFCDRLLGEEYKDYDNIGNIENSPGGEQSSPLEDSSGSGGSFPQSSGANQGSGPEQSSASSVTERNSFPETWLWDLEMLSPTGEFSEVKILPDTITEWNGRAVCVHPTEGVGISGEASIVTFTPFFTVASIPSSGQRGEVLSIVISVFNYIDEVLPVLLTVEESENFNFVDGETGVRQLCVSSNEKVVSMFNVRLTDIGDIDIVVEAKTETREPCSLMRIFFNNIINLFLAESYFPPCICGSEQAPPDRTDRLTRSFPVEPEGYVRENTLNMYVCAQDASANGTFEPFDITTPEYIVPDSGRAWITASGDLIGPTIENLGSLIRLPGGCGEQNMVNFAPNVYIYQYLTETNQLTDEIEEKLQLFLRRGYQNQLKFRRQDGSYSAFGSRDQEGSTWLTAFVVKSFAQAKPFTLIDEMSLDQSETWLVGLQDPESGCFASNGRVINKMLQGGSAESEVLLSSFVVTALLEGGFDNFNLDFALNCVGAETSDNPYSLALKGYTLALANDSRASDVLSQLLDSSFSDDSIIRWNLPNRQGTSTSLHVETAAYALLAFLTFDPVTYSEETRKILRWLISQRNTQGGFVSTQDTVVALQALSAFEKINPSAELNLSITVSSNDQSHVFTVKEDNKFLQQRVDVQSIPSTYELSIEGSGCVLIQAAIRYNVEAESLSDAFTLSVETSSESCKVQTINACTSYTLSDGASNMAIIEVTLMSDYSVIEEDIRDLVESSNGDFKKYEIDIPRVILYLEELTDEEVCATFNVYQGIAFDVAKPGSIVVYDYYQPEFLTSQQYTFSTDC